MKGSIRDILPDRIGAESEGIINELLERKLTTAARMTVELLRALEERLGPEVRRVVLETIHNRRHTPRSRVGDMQQDLRDFCRGLERNCIGSHRWNRIIDEPHRIGYEFTRCIWADIFRKLDEPELGFYFCAGDEPAAEAYNAKLKFQRSKVLMKGDRICDHIFYVE